MSSKKRRRKEVDVTRDFFKTPLFQIKDLKLTDKQKELVRLVRDKDCKVLFLSGPAGTAKAQPLDAELITPDGWKKMGSIAPGDFVYGQDGKPCKVLEVHPQGVKEIFKVSFTDGAYTECCEDHLWEAQSYNERNRKSKIIGGKGKVFKNPIIGKIRTTKEISESLYTKGGKLNYSIPMCEPVEFPEKVHLIDPYILGILIGDGGLTNRPCFTSADQQIVEEISKRLPDGFSVSKVPSAKYAYSLVLNSQKGHPKNLIWQELKRLGLAGLKSNLKFIPEEYLFDSIKNRKLLLAGLMDSDGTTSGPFSSYTTVSEALSRDIKSLIESLGGTAKTSYKEYNYYKLNGEVKRGQPSYFVSVMLDFNPFLLKRKQDRYVIRTKYKARRYITNVELVGEKECQCILVDHPRHLYLTNNYIVTHNTFTSAFAGLSLLRDGTVGKIKYIRSLVESSQNKMGYLPGTGDIDGKLAPYAGPLYDKLEELLQPYDSKRLMEEKIIEVLPPNFLRGMTFKDSFVIVDESQNMPFGDLITTISRIGENSTIVFCYDPIQKDIKNSGIEKLANIFNDEESKANGIYSFGFTAEDIMRSCILRYIMSRLEKSV